MLGCPVIFALPAWFSRLPACGGNPEPWIFVPVIRASAPWNIRLRVERRGAWNTAVRTRGVFTHRDDFLKPACAERGLVRTRIALGRPGLVSTESQSFQNQRPLSSAPSTFQSPPPIPSLHFHSIPFHSLLHHRCVRALTGVRYNEANLTFRETTMSFGHIG